MNPNLVAAAVHLGGALSTLLWILVFVAIVVAIVVVARRL